MAASASRKLDFVTCRLLGHAWEKFVPFDRTYRQGGGYDLPLRCIRCGTERFDNFDKAGALSRRKYQYADNYLMGKGVERPTSDSLRLLFARVEHVKFEQNAQNRRSERSA